MENASPPFIANELQCSTKGGIGFIIKFRGIDFGKLELPVWFCAIEETETLISLNEIDSEFSEIKFKVIDEYDRDKIYYEHKGIFVSSSPVSEAMNDEDKIQVYQVNHNALLNHYVKWKTYYNCLIDFDNVPDVDNVWAIAENIHAKNFNHVSRFCYTLSWYLLEKESTLQADQNILRLALEMVNLIKDDCDDDNLNSSTSTSNNIKAIVAVVVVVNYKVIILQLPDLDSSITSSASMPFKLPEDLENSKISLSMEII
ncbi:hypothetical protein Glove_141g68 [Diversispora epigaea]|uniref:Uncharacterized protein n=1 Tax=Diversispora epigaea TaxID=1348612 RepID=A0A397J4G4_9GLOM|nr:hypothetical protein Glove_141g68 [Diversispora epigaea]